MFSVGRRLPRVVIVVAEGLSSGFGRCEGKSEDDDGIPIFYYYFILVKPYFLFGESNPKSYLGRGSLRKKSLFLSLERGKGIFWDEV